MSDHLTQTQIEHFGRNPNSAIKSLSLSDHLGNCEACSLRLEDALNDDTEYLDLKAELFDGIDALFPRKDHLNFEEMAQIVDGTIKGEELQIARDHLSRCEYCEQTVKELRAFKVNLAPGFNQKRRPASQTSGGSRWLGQFFRTKFPIFIFGPAMAALLLALSGWLLWHIRSESRFKRQMAVVTVSPEVHSTRSPEPMDLPVVSQFKDGENLLAINLDGHLIGGEKLPPAYQKMIENALASLEIEKSPLLSGSARGKIVSRGGEGAKEEFSVNGPVGELTLSDRPLFRWSPLEGATGYVVEVFDKDLNLAMVSPQITENLWTPSKPLKRGDTYFWEVKANREGRNIVAPSSQTAKFRVLDEPMAAELSRARSSYGSSHLTMGLLYARAGLLTEAERELREFQKANPDSEVASQLLGKIQGMRRTQKL